MLATYRDYQKKLTEIKENLFVFTVTMEYGDKFSIHIDLRVYH